MSDILTGSCLCGAVATYDKAADSGNMVTRSFCPTCGCQMWSENSAMPHMVFLHANSLDDPEVFQPMFVVYRNVRHPGTGSRAKA